MKNIESLDLRMQPGVKKLIQLCARDLVPIIILETRRSLAVQIAYYSRGRTPTAFVQNVFKRIGLWEISTDEATKINTQTLYSKHIDGLAIDLAPEKDGKPWWGASREVWEKIWNLAETQCGLDACAGGKWNAWTLNGRAWDLPHVEFRVPIGG